MSAITFFPVGNGAMTLIRIDNAFSPKNILIDMNIKNDDEGNDVIDELRGKLWKNADGHPIVDVLLITHNDKDHLAGVSTHFHLGDLSEYNAEDDKIIIAELWTSYRFWRRASDSYTLTDDAKALNREMKRRVACYSASKTRAETGNRAVIFCECPDGRTDEVYCPVKKLDDEFSTINETNLSPELKIRVLGPLEQNDDEADDDFLEKNRGSVILSIDVDGCRLLIPGDAEVAVWEQLYEKNKNNLSILEYDILLTPHHTSWHSLSRDSQSDCREQGKEAKVEEKARIALSQAREGAFIVSSSNAIEDDDNDPPCYHAKKIYCDILSDENHFLCTGDKDTPITFNLSTYGPQLEPEKNNYRSCATIKSTGVALPHGQ